MSKYKKFEADKEAIEILKLGKIEGNVYYLPNITLERSQYEEVNKILVALGAKWNKKEKGHVFDYDIKSELIKTLETGLVTDWKKSTDFFYTPEAVVNEMFGYIQKPLTSKFDMLEPSAGQGHILDLFKTRFPHAFIACVEQNPLHCQRLKEKGYSPIQDDFISVELAPIFDVVLMNPPFTYEMEHIRKAYDFLCERGRLITVTSSTILSKNTKKGKKFRAWIDEIGGYYYALPLNSFKESGTSVDTQLLILDK